MIEMDISHFYEINYIDIVAEDKLCYRFQKYSRNIVKL